MQKIATSRTPNRQASRPVGAPDRRPARRPAAFKQIVKISTVVRPDSLNNDGADKVPDWSARLDARAKVGVRPCVSQTGTNLRARDSVALAPLCATFSGPSSHAGYQMMARISLAGLLFLVGAASRFPARKAP